MSDWEDEFTGSVEERLEKFGSAFADPALGGSADALSRLQKQALSQMRKKAKDKRKGGKSQSFGRADPNHPPNEIDPDADYSRTYRRPEKIEEERPDKGYGKPKKKKSSFGREFTPRVRHIEDDIIEEPVVDKTPPTPSPAIPLSPAIPSSDDLKQRRKQASKHGGFRIIGGGKDD